VNAARLLPFVPYALVTLFLGAAGLLLYLIRRRDKASA
jgi:hypothetical protein